jgi:hypothetical protein
MRPSGVVQRCAAGRCTRRRSIHGLLCKTCWMRLPASIQIRVAQATLAYEASPRPERHSELQAAREAALRAVA